MLVAAKSMLFIDIAFLCGILLGGVESRSYKYNAHDRVSLAANTVGPFNNPTETYPVCS